MASPSRLPSIRRPAGNNNKSRPVSMIEGPMSNIPNLSSTFNELENPKKAKRRSLLPQFNRKVSNEEKANEEASIQEEDETGSGGSSRPASGGTRGSGESTGRKAIDEERQSVPVVSKLSRPMSMIPPRGASQFRVPQAIPAHVRGESKDKDMESARADSLAALTGAVTPTEPTPQTMTPVSPLKRTGSTKLPQSPRSGGPTIPSRTTSTGIKHAHSRTISNVNRNPIAAERARPPSVHGAATSQATNETSMVATSMMSRSRPSSQMPQRTSPPPAPVLSRSRPQSQMPPPAMKPAFTTFQQHYSPAKSALPKPPIPVRTHSKASPSIEEEVSASSDATKQQLELLQLTLLHQSSAQCLQEYTASAKRKLGRIHGKLRKDYESIRATELVHQRAANLSALEAWCSDPAMLVENLQILSLVYSDLTSIMEEGSRHVDVISIFELWMNEAESSPSGELVETLPEEWKTAHASLALKLRAVQRNLRVLPPQQPPPAGSNNQDSSGLDVVLKGCRVLVEEMLKELEIMTKLEKEVLAKERSKVEDEVKALVVNREMKEEWIPAWQKV